MKKREFPESWSEGLRSAVFKSGKTSKVENYRGITILPMLEKIFEIAVYKRLSFVNEVYSELTNLDDTGFTTWVGNVKALATLHKLDITCDMSTFKIACKRNVRSNFINNWNNELHNLSKNPILRTYTIFKSSFELEPYLKLVKEYKYRVAIARLRSSSHTLAIERCCYERPKPPIEQRLCILCNTVEDEIHFVTQCAVNQAERSVLEANVSKLYPSFSFIDNYQKFVFLMKTNDAIILTWFGKFLHNSFNTEICSIRRIIQLEFNRVLIYSYTMHLLHECMHVINLRYYPLWR